MAAKTNNKIKVSIGGRIFDSFNHLLFTILAMIMVFPFWNMLVTSLTSYSEYVKNPLSIWFRELDFSTYKLIFAEGYVVQSMYVTVIITVFGTLSSMLITLFAAYALSKNKLPGRMVFMTAILFTMIFSGGLIPYYLLIKNLGLINKIPVMIIPSLVNTFNLIVIMNYFRGIPPSLEDSAKIDGANDITVLIRVILPISKPIIATFTLFYGVAYWNEWWNAMLFINNRAKYPLQMLLRQLVVKQAMLSEMAARYMDETGGAHVHSVSIKMATIVVATIPILIVYPFLQKHFAKGVLIGSMKG